MSADPEPQWLDADEQRTWRAFLMAGHRVDAALDRQLLRDAGMSHAQYGILVALEESDEGTLRMGELAAVLDYSKSRLTHAVNALEEQGWVQRQACPSDKRGQFAVITASGRAALRRAAPGHVAEVRRLIFDVVPRAEQACLYTALARVVAHFAVQSQTLP